MGGGRGVDGNFTCWRADLHIRARNLHVCVHMFTYMDRALCVSVCSRVCTQIIHVCLYMFTCTHTGSVFVCIHVYIHHMCV